MLSFLSQATKVADAVVRVVALIVVALAIVVPLVIVLTLALFKTDSQDYAKDLFKSTIDLFKAILGPDRQLAA